MSCDTGKENASVVDSSLTEWKQDMGNLDDPVSSSYKANEDALPHGAAERGNSHNQVRNVSENKEGRLYGTRYFIIKSLNHQNIQLSIERGIWATQVMNEPILDEAFHNSGKVILIFSVNMSGFFQGYAQMISSVGWRRDSVWSQGNGGSNPWGRNFKVKWLCLRDLPFQRTLHLKNPLNEYKPVKISRDCQELPEDIGVALCELLDGNFDADGQMKGYHFSLKLKDYGVHSNGKGGGRCISTPRVKIPLGAPAKNELFCSGFPSKRPCIEPPYSVQDDQYNFRPMHIPWARSPILHPSLLHPQEAEASTLQFTHPRSPGVYPPENFPLTSGASRVAQRIQSRSNGRLDHDVSSQSDVWGLSAEESPLSTLTEDDFLEMSYEEYLEVHSRSRKHNPAAGKSRSVQETSSSKQHDEESCSRSRGDRHHSNHSSHK